MRSLQNLLTSWKAQIAALCPVEDDEPIPEGQPSNREQIIAELLEIERCDRDQAAAYQSRLDSLGKELQTAQQRVAKLHREIDVEHGQWMTLRFGRDARINRLRSALAAGCPTEVDELLERIGEEIESLQRTRSMEARVAERLTVLIRARQEAEALKMAPVADVLASLRQLERDIFNVKQEHRRELVAAR